MTPRSSHLSGLLLAASLLSTSVTAQNTANITDYDRCDPGRPYNLDSINGTGTANVSDLYLHVAFRERRNPNDTGARSLAFDPHTTIYLSAPEDSQKQACVYMFKALDGNRQGGGQNGCEGVLPKTCTDLIEKSYMFSEPQETVPGGFACPTNMDQFKDEINKACGEALLDRGSVSTVVSNNLTNTSCAESVHQPFDLPDGYRTHNLLTWMPTEYDTQVDNFTWYDDYITRPVPMVIATVVDGKRESRMVCVAPDDVRQGNRVPAEDVNKPGKADDESGAVGMEWGRKAGLAGLMAGVAGMSFVLA